MTAPSRFRRLAAPGLLALTLDGCGGAASVEPPPTSPPMTAEQSKAAAAKVNAGRGEMKSPGVKALPAPK